ncbi:SDR family oxidoreductase [Cupriavidus basilensis]|uniref:SDR family oxidoreductase n=1 Tax=Cupriavidus basilensis TaxID=68895 RepID=UPI0023E84E81|nr:SDR family oxidoreductase [Cupriavidus basilensis]MDF3885826.1 SDR family oxidoreductase [Cupriavidus basilensis]
MANEFGQFGIRANSISPGISRTSISGDALNIPRILQAFAACFPLGHIGTVDDVAEAALWLASDACFMTKRDLQVSGGLT